MSANGYELFIGQWSRQAASEVLELSPPSSGMTVLDVACGTGSFTASLLASYDVDQLVCIDRCVPFAAHARTRFAQDGRVAVQVADAVALPFRQASFDMTYSHLAVPYMKNAPAALAEMVRVTKAGGVVTASAWCRGAFEPTKHFWAEVRRGIEEGLPEVPAVSDRSPGLLDLWRSAGLDDIGTCRFNTQKTYSSFDEYWSSIVTSVGRQRQYVANLGGGAYTRLREGLRERLTTASDNACITMSAQAVAIRGVVSRRR